jgi:O-acetylhomoserine (thiol)-lyase
MLTRPEPSYHDVVYTEQYGRAAFVARCRTVGQRNSGATLSPFNGFLILQGLETLALRVERHVENARRVAEFLRDHRAVEWVNYTGFPDNPYFELAQKYLGGKSPSLLTFGVRGGFAGGKRFLDGLKMFKRLVNMGDAKSLATHPASTTHRQLTPDELLQAGITPETVRLSIGIEHIDDILADLDQALGAAA